MDNKVKRYLKPRFEGYEVKTIDNFLEDMSAYHITDELKRDYRERLERAYEEAKRTDIPQVVMGEGDLFLVVFPTSVVATAKTIDYYDLLTEQELALKRLEKQYTRGEIPFLELKEKKREILESN